MNEYAGEFVSALITSKILEFLKMQKWFPFLNNESSERYKQIIGALAAFIATVGIQYNFDTTTGDFHMNLYQMYHASSDFAIQWIFQQVTYDKLIKPKKEEQDKLTINMVSPV